MTACGIFRASRVPPSEGRWGTAPLDAAVQMYAFVCRDYHGVLIDAVFLDGWFHLKYTKKDSLEFSYSQHFHKRHDNLVFFCNLSSSFASSESGQRL